MRSIAITVLQIRQKKYTTNTHSVKIISYHSIIAVVYNINDTILHVHTYLKDNDLCRLARLLALHVASRTIIISGTLVQTNINYHKNPDTNYPWLLSVIVVLMGCM